MLSSDRRHHDYRTPLRLCLGSQGRSSSGADHRLAQLVPRDLSQVNWKDVGDEAHRQCKNLSTVYDFQQLTEVRIAALESLALSLDRSLYDLAKTQRKAAAAYDRPPRIINTGALQHKGIRVASSLSAKALALRAEAHGVQDEPPLLPKAKPSHRLRDMRRHQAINACTSSLVGLVQHLASVERLLLIAEEDINLTLIGLYLALPKQGPQIVLEFPRRPTEANSQTAGQWY